MKKKINIILFIILIIISFPLLKSYFFNDTLVQVPSVLNLHKDEAIKKLKDANLDANIISSRSVNVPVDYVYTQKPAAGTYVKQNRAIRIFINDEDGKKVPELVGKTLTEAMSILEKDQIPLKRVDYISMPNRENEVIAVYPETDSVLEYNGKVSLLVSTRNLTNFKKMPNIVGLDVNEANRVLAQIGYKIDNISRISNTTFPINVIVSTNPIAESELNEDTKISVVISEESSNKIEQEIIKEKSIDEIIKKAIEDKEVNKIKAYIISKSQGFYEAKADDKIYKLKLRGYLKKNNSKFNCVIGDFVEFDEKDLVITKVYDRKNLLLRPLIANVDNLVLLFSYKDPKFDIINFQKSLLWADMQNIESILLINKIDLEESSVVEEYINELNKIFKHIKILAISLEEKINLDKLKELIENKHIVLSGPSGVGKSSLVNYLMKDNVSLVGDISYKTKKGKNTTMFSKYFCENNIEIFDTPGYSSIDIPTFKDKTEIYKAFPEFYNKTCKFRDCLHLKEPNCGIKDDVEKNIIDKIRYEFYCNIVEGEYSEKY